jgi:hypothetical protein
MNESDAIDLLKNAALSQSKIYNNGDMNYAFAFGYLTGDVTNLLQELNLNKRQFKVLKSFVDRSVNR